MKKLNFLIFVFVISGFLLLGCAHTLNINVTEIGDYSQPLIELLPINVGVYYGNDFRTYKTVQENYYTDGVTRISNIRLGEANIALFDYILSQTFKNVTSIHHLPNGLESLRNIDLIIEPTVLNYIYSESQEFLKPATYVYIKYRINFYSPDGLENSTWEISGGSSKYKMWHGIEVLSGHTSAIELTQLAMEKVAVQFFTDFCNQIDIKTLFDKQCNQ